MLIVYLIVHHTQISFKVLVKILLLLLELNVGNLHLLLGFVKIEIVPIVSSIQIILLVLIIYQSVLMMVLVVILCKIFVLNMLMFLPFNAKI